MAGVLVVPDLHEPFSRKGSIKFCKKIKRKYKCDTVLLIGDLNDSHGVSFHAAHPDLPGPADEFDLAYLGVKRWYKAFPNAKVCLGNHDRRVTRLAESVNIPSKFLRSYADVWETPNWDWDFSHVIDNVLYIHGDGAGGGANPAYNKMRSMGMSCVMGHFHKHAGVKWLFNQHKRMFGMDVGALIDDSSLAFAYAQGQTLRSGLGVGVVLDGKEAYWVPMPIGEGEEFHDSNF